MDYGHPMTDPWYHYSNHSGNYWPHRVTKIAIEESVKPLQQQVQRFDSIRLTLEKDGGGRKEMEELEAALITEFSMKGSYGEEQCCLKNPISIKKTLQKIGCSSVHFEVRRLKNGMPAYLLCRLQNDYYSSTPLVMEELHQSPDFPMADKRFIRLMRHGRERFYLNLGSYFGCLNMEIAKRDELLFRLGRQVLLAAWHEDQYPGLMTADVLKLYSFPHGIELLYLLLSGDLPNLRHSIDENMISFFETICPQPAIAAFLRNLPQMDAGSLARLPKQARKYYKVLAVSFGALLHTKVRWGSRNTTVELYKILFGNFSRPEALGDTLLKDNNLWEVAKLLEQKTEAIIAELTGINKGLLEDGKVN
jgi:hypothetical protein